MEKKVMDIEFCITVHDKSESLADAGRHLMMRFPVRARAVAAQLSLSYPGYSPGQRIESAEASPVVIHAKRYGNNR
jgi:hypothetical protein